MRYVVIHSRTHGDTSEHERRTLDEARKQAYYDWFTLSASDKARTRVSVVVSTDDDIENGDLDSDYRLNQYAVRFAQTGDIVDKFDCIEDATDAIIEYERDDRNEGCFEENCYEIAELHEDGLYYSID